MTKREKLIAIFNEWSKNFLDNPDEFYLLNKDTFANYGEHCAEHFMEIEKKLFKIPLGPGPRRVHNSPKK